MFDRILKGTAANGQLRFFITDCTETVKKASKTHELSDVSSYVFGKFICAGLLMGAEMKNEDNVLTLSTESDSRSGKVIVTVNGKSEVKAYMQSSESELDESILASGISLDSAVLGKGFISVIRDIGLKTPYTGKVEMKFGTVAQDITYYYASSEQIPTSISLGVLMDQKRSVRKAGGFLIQLMPGFSSETVETLERNILKLPNFTDLLDMGYTLEDILEKMILKEFNISIHSEVIPKYKCGCSRSKMRSAVKMLTKKEIMDTFKKFGHIEVKCHFCNRSYKFFEEDILSGPRKNKKI